MLFAKSQLMGTFKGFNERGLEFAAEIVAPYDSSMLDRPQLGQFLLIELGSEQEASLGRVTRFVPTGLLASAEGEDYVNTMQRRNQNVPEDLKQQRLKYRVQVKLLGAVRSDSGKVQYVPSQRRLPHLGAKVALPSADVLSALCSLSDGNTDLGSFVLGEFVFCGSGIPLKNPALRAVDPPLRVTFNIQSLVSRRSVVFARAGYGKSNLIKFLISELYRQQPTTMAGKPVGTLIFDPDGEYFWPDAVRGRPGFCDVPQLQNSLALFTNRRPPSQYYGSWKLGEVKLDIRDLPARDVIGIGVSADRQDQQNVLKLKGLREAEWRQLVDLVHRDGLQANDQLVGQLLGYATPQQLQSAAGEIGAAKSNMSNVVRLLHDPNSKLLSGTLKALKAGGIVVVDISLLSNAAGTTLAGLLMRKVFSHNQENFTGGEDIIPTVVVIEEAQSVLGRNLNETSPFVEWVKEGRKYELGAILITQQPGSMAPEILSQSDNWFSFHLLSAGDAGTLGKYNAHYSDDILAHLISEPIEGNCYMWSAPKQPFALPVRIRDFEELYRAGIKEKKTELAVSARLVRDVSEQVATSLDSMVEALRDRLSQRNVKFVKQSEGEVELWGVYSGQLFHVIKEIKPTTETQSEEALKEPLLNALLGHGAIVRRQHDSREYLCASKEAWVTAGLGEKVRWP